MPPPNNVQAVTRALLLSKVEPEPNTGCWLWSASLRAGNGYGQVRVGRRLRYAHVVSFEVHSGMRLGPGLQVCHSCDVRSCINPDHLFFGTQRENMQDALRKGRLAHCRQTHCVNGHLRTPDSTVTYQRRRSTVTLCRICQKRNAARAHARYLLKFKHAA